MNIQNKISAHLLFCIQNQYYDTLFQSIARKDVNIIQEAVHKFRVEQILALLERQNLQILDFMSR